MGNQTTECSKLDDGTIH